MDDSTSKKSDKNVGFLNFNKGDDRKSHKRDIAHKTKTDDEVVATVMEIAGETTTIAPTTESIAGTTTEPSESSTIEMASEKVESTTASVPSSTAETSAAAMVDTDFQPLNWYYGGTPNENANYIFFTTSSPLLDNQSPTQIPDSISERYDWGEFKPSLQYEYSNNRFIPANHFYPVSQEVVKKLKL